MKNILCSLLTFFLFSIFLVGIIHTYRNFCCLIIEFVEGKPGFAGEDIVYKFALTVGDNYSREQIKIGFDANTMEVTDIACNEIAYVQLFVPPLSRGFHHPGRLLVQSFFPLGILRVWTWVDVQAKSIIYPKILKGAQPYGTSPSGDQDDQDDLTGGSDDFSGLRRYQEGDSLSRVYWKVLSRGMPLATKEFEKPNESYSWLSLDKAVGSLEERLSILTFWVLKYAQDNQRFGLLLGDERIPLGRGSIHKQKCLEALALYRK